MSIGAGGGGGGGDSRLTVMTGFKTRIVPVDFTGILIGVD
jgi:hypothetical protein